MSEALRRLLDRLDRLQASWESLTASCDTLPRTLVHGDFVPKNIRLASRGEEMALYPFDWETVGFGTPVADLSAIDIPLYVDDVRHLWPNLSIVDVRQCVLVGRVFRFLASIDWSCDNLHRGWNTRAESRSSFDAL
jgi:hypothetical protein